MALSNREEIKNEKRKTALSNREEARKKTKNGSLYSRKKHKYLQESSKHLQLRNQRMARSLLEKLALSIREEL